MAFTRPFPTSITGETGRWQDGGCFASGQGGVEWFQLTGPHASIEAQCVIVHLADDTWLDNSCFIHASAAWPTRAEALWYAANRVRERVVMLSRRAALGKPYMLPSIGLVEANAILAWASALAGAEWAPLAYQGASGTPRHPTPRTTQETYGDLPLFAHHAR